MTKADLTGVESLNRILDPSDGFMDDIHSVRDEEGCDVAMLLVALVNDGS